MCDIFNKYPELISEEMVYKQYRGRKVLVVGDRIFDSANLAKQFKEVLSNRQRDGFTDYIVGHYNTYLIAIKILGEKNGNIKF